MLSTVVSPSLPTYAQVIVFGIMVYNGSAHTYTNVFEHDQIFPIITQCTIVPAFKKLLAIPSDF